MDPAGIVQDLRYALRQMLRAPAFAVTAVLTLAIGVGANLAKRLNDLDVAADGWGGVVATYQLVAQALQ